MKFAFALRALVVGGTLLVVIGCSSPAPTPTPEAVKNELQQLQENRERERSNQ